MHNPCKDCTSREQACAVTCKRWQKYVKWRNEMYDRRMQERMFERSVVSNIIKFADKSSDKKRRVKSYDQT